MIDARPGQGSQTAQDASQPTLAGAAIVGLLPSPDDPEAQRVRAELYARLVGDERSPPRIGRFTLLGKVAEGGMGVVFAAYDGELDRKVAIKVIKRELDREGMRGRIVREAQAMAKLSHPNVAQVYEVGDHQGSTFIAMEFVRGATLRAWQSEPRSWREKVAMYVQAARGLAAAHQAGILHRDFKPDNAIVGRDGRVRVLDFGLARAEATEPTEELLPQTVLPAPDHDALATPLTKTGAVMGTPAYMAPEQLLGESLDAKVDQFALCVSLWEALVGERPFAGKTRVELVANVTRGKLREPSKDARFPPWIRNVLARGLAVGPMDRFASIEALIDALQTDPTRRRRRILAATTVVGALGLVLGGWTLDRERRTRACIEHGEAITQVWNDDERAAVRAGLLATGAGHANVTALRVTPWLDAHADEWRNARTEACLDVQVRDAWDEDTHDRAVWCLDERRFELAALVNQLEHADVGVVTKAVPAAANLRRIDACRDRELLQRLPGPPASGRDGVQAVQETLSRAVALEATGGYAQGLAIATSSLADADAVDWPPLIAAVRVRVGILLERNGKYDDAESMLESAYFTAAGAGALEEALLAAESLGRAVGERRARPHDAERWWNHAEVLRKSLPDPAGLREATSLTNLAVLRKSTARYAEAATLHRQALAIFEQALGHDHVAVAKIHNDLGVVHFSTGDYAGAAQQYEQALAIGAAVLGPDHPEIAVSLTNLGNVSSAMGDYEEAATRLERALAIQQGALGPDHPFVARSVANLGTLHARTGSYAEAAACYERALTIQEKALGPDHPDVATSLGNLSGVLYETGDYAEAAALRERAVAIEEKVLGPDHPDLALGLGNLGNLRQATGDYAAAAALYERALAIHETALGADHPNVAVTLNNLAAVGYTTGAYEEARPRFERAREIWEKALGADHPVVATPLVGLARVALARHRPVDAVTLAERAAKLRDNGEAPAADVAEARFVLAQALVAAGESRARAIALAKQAHELYRESGQGYRGELAKVEAFTREHGGARGRATSTTSTAEFP